MREFRGDVLKSRRIADNLSRQQLAELVDTTYETIAHLETGRRSPSMELFVTLCKILDVSPNTLLGWEYKNGKPY